MKTRITILAPILLLCLPAMVWAHAFLDHADPKVGSEMNQSPAQIKAWFTQQPETDFSVIQVFDDQGKEVDNKDTHADSADPKLLIVTLPPLQPGKYKVHWHVVSVDTHTTEGDFEFTFKPGS
jgi:copper resistance protein C